MTRSTQARWAGTALLVYIAAGIASLVFARQAQAAGVLSMLAAFSALMLGVTLYAITRAQDAELALLALACRIVEAVPGGEGTGALFFAVGSAIFSWLLLRGRMVPAMLARLGVFASLLLVASLLLRRAGLFADAVNWGSTAAWLLWLPMLVFELALAFWFLTRGVAAEKSP